MDLAKFVAILSSKTLYFPSVLELMLADPFEGTEPKSHVVAISGILQKNIDDSLALRGQFPEPSLAEFDKIMDHTLEKFAAAPQEAAARFGITCWHKNEDESDAMWKLYTAMGQGIAIESTTDLLKASLERTEGLTFADVRYADFDHDPIDKGHANYGLFMKRKAFEHEREHRGTLLIERNPFGKNVPCNLDELIVGVHISPSATAVFKTAVEALCATYLPAEIVVRKSSLLDPPNYSVKDYLSLQNPKATR